MRGIVNAVDRRSRRLCPSYTNQPARYGVQKVDHCIVFLQIYSKTMFVVIHYDIKRDSDSIYDVVENHDALVSYIQTLMAKDHTLKAVQPPPCNPHIGSIVPLLRNDVREFWVQRATRVCYDAVAGLILFARHFALAFLPPLPGLPIFTIKYSK